MQSTSNTWKSLAAKIGSGVRLESKAIINGTEYTDISAPLISRSVMNNGLSIGNVVSATCQLSVRTNDAIPKSAEVQIKMRLTDGATTSEWRPAGTFYVSKRKKDPMMGVVAFECYDALLKANVVVPDTVPWTTNTGERITDGDGNDIYISAVYPRDMLGMVNDIAGILGIDVDSRTQIITSSGYSIPAPSNEAVTIRDILSVIATANCGNWVVTPDNKLRLVPVNSASNAASATNDVVDIIAVLNDTSTGTETQTISGIRNTYDDTVYFTGDETGIVVDVSTVPAIAAEIAETLIGKTYQAYELANAVYDPAVEIGDYVRRGDTISSILCVESVVLGNLFVGSISAPDPSEIDDEFPYIGTGAKSVAISKAYAQEVAAEVAAELDNSLDQETVFNRLTNNGAAQGMYLVNGQLYVSASYIQTGTMVANLIKGGTLTLGGMNNAAGVMQVLDANGNVVGMWDNSGIMLKINNSSSQYVSLGALGFKIFLDSGSTVQTSFIVYEGSSSYYPTNIPLGDLRVQYNDENGEHWETIISPCGVTLKHYQITGEVITNHSTFHIGADGLFYKDDDSGAYLSIAPSLNRLVFGGDLFVHGAVSCGNGANGTFTTANGKTVTVTNGIITSIA